MIGGSLKVDTFSDCYWVGQKVRSGSGFSVTSYELFGKPNTSITLCVLHTQVAAL